jgi:hypothetical protein
MILTFPGDSSNERKSQKEKKKAREWVAKASNPRWYRVRASQGLKKPSQRHWHYDGSCFVRITTGSARTYLSFQIQVISSLIPSLIIIIIIKKKKKHEGFVSQTKNTSQRARENEKRFYFSSRTSSSSFYY